MFTIQVGTRAKGKEIKPPYLCTILYCSRKGQALGVSGPNWKQLLPGPRFTAKVCRTGQPKLIVCQQARLCCMQHRIEGGCGTTCSKGNYFSAVREAISVGLLGYAPVKSLVKIQAAWCNARRVMTQPRSTRPVPPPLGPGLPTGPFFSLSKMCSTLPPPLLPGRHANTYLLPAGI